MVGSMSRSFYRCIFVLLFTGMRMHYVMFNSGFYTSMEMDYLTQQDVDSQSERQYHDPRL
jgi:hypothetical protein